MSSRQELIEAAMRAGRESSTASVLLHSVIAAQVGLGATDQKTLDVLLRLGPLTAGEIGTHTNLTSASVTSLVDRLEKRGFVRRERDAHDRRRVVVHANRERLVDFWPYFEPYLKRLSGLLESYSDAELLVIIDFLSRIADLSHHEATRIAETSRHSDGKQS